MVVPYRSLKYEAVQVNYEDKYQERLLKFNFSISRADNTD